MRGRNCEAETWSDTQVVCASAAYPGLNDRVAIRAAGGWEPAAYDLSAGRFVIETDYRSATAETAVPEIESVSCSDAFSLSCSADGNDVRSVTIAVRGRRRACVRCVRARIGEVSDEAPCRWVLPSRMASRWWTRGASALAGCRATLSDGAPRGLKSQLPGAPVR